MLYSTIIYLDLDLITIYKAKPILSIFEVWLCRHLLWVDSVLVAVLRLYQLFRSSFRTLKQGALGIYLTIYLFIYLEGHAICGG